MNRAPPHGLRGQIRQNYAEYAELHGALQAKLELLLIPPLLVAGLFLLLFAAPILESISHG